MSKQRYYYVSGNTAQGLVNYLATNIKDIDQVIVLKHVSHTLKTAILQHLLKQFTDMNEEVDVFASPFGNEYIEGIMMKDQSLAIITDTVLTSEVNKIQEVELKDLFPVQHTETLHSTEIIGESREKAYEKLAKALKIHDDLETIYIREMDFRKANELSNQFIKNMLQNIPTLHRKSHIYQRLFGTNTDQGPVNHLPQLIDQIANRVYVKGRAGTGKSVFMKKIIKACENHGLDVEQYHCSFDSNSIDMVLVPDLDLCVFDSTAPHEFAPESKGDKIIDLYEETVTLGTDEKHAKEIAAITGKYKAVLKEGIEDLKLAKIEQDKVEEFYKNIDHMKVQMVTEQIFKNRMH